MNKKMEIWRGQVGTGTSCQFTNEIKKITQQEVEFRGSVLVDSFQFELSLKTLDIFYRKKLMQCVCIFPLIIKSQLHILGEPTWFQAIFSTIKTNESKILDQCIYSTTQNHPIENTNEFNSPKLLYCRKIAASTSNGFIL